jgi:uncharacterized membrane protein
VLLPQGNDGENVTKTWLEAFSDGVVVIAITLLVIEIRPPRSTEMSGSPTPCGRSGPATSPTW